MILSESSKYEDDNKKIYNFVNYFDLIDEYDNYEDIGIDNLITCIEYNLKPEIFNQNLENLQYYKSDLEQLGKSIFSNTLF